MSFRVKLRLKQMKPILTDPELLKRLIESAREKPGPALASSCPVCGMSFTDAMGRPVAMGYVCGHSRCPSRVWAGPALPHQQYGHASIEIGAGTSMLWN